MTPLSLLTFFWLLYCENPVSKPELNSVVHIYVYIYIQYYVWYMYIYINIYIYIYHIRIDIYYIILIHYNLHFLPLISFFQNQFHRKFTVQ